LRIEELTTHTWNAFRQIENQWWFFVKGKGDKKAKIPVNDQLLRSLIQYRLFLRKPPLPLVEDKAPLIHSFRTGKAITPRQVNKILKKLALATADKFKDYPDKVKKIKKFSAHWLRHLSASQQDRAGITFKHIRQNLRHENDETTRRYVHAFDQERYHDMQKLTLRMDILFLKQERD
jgi:site-specific recombinase XerD